MKAPQWPDGVGPEQPMKQKHDLALLPIQTPNNIVWNKVQIKDDVGKSMMMLGKTGAITVSNRTCCMFVM